MHNFIIPCSLSHVIVPKYCHVGASLQILGENLDWRQCGNSLALCYFAVVMELPDSLWMDCKSEFGVILSTPRHNANFFFKKE